MSASVARQWGRHRLCLLAALAVLSTAPAQAAEALPGPVPAEVTAVIDGDTLAVRARIWLDQTVETRVRLAGVDAPELRGDCAAERRAAAAARALLAALTADGAVTLRNIVHDKYGGRVVAEVADADGRDLGAALVESGMAAAYDGGPRRPWCELAEGRRDPD